MKKLISFAGHLYKSIQLLWVTSPFLFVCRVAIELVTVAVPIVSAYLTKLAIDMLSDASAVNKFEAIIPLIATVVGLHILGTLLGKLNVLLSSNHQDLITNHINMQVLEKINSLDISYFDNPKFHNEIQNARRDSGSLASLSWIIVSAIKAVMQIVSAGIVLGTIGFYFPLLIIIFGIPSSFVDRGIAKKKYDWERSKTTNNRKMGYVSNILDGQPFSKDVRVFNTYDFIIGKYKALWSSWFKERRSMDRKRLMASFTASLIPYIPIAYIMFYICVKIINGQLSIGDFAFYNGIATQFLGGTASLIMAFNQGYESEMRLTNFYGFLGWESRIQNRGTKELHSVDSIEFSHVGFTYPQTERGILRDISFQIGKNEKIALVGVNGAGKSTIVKLLMRLYDPSNGEIRINGINIKEYDINSLRQAMGVVFQDYNKYLFQLNEAVAIADTTRKDDEMRIHTALASADFDMYGPAFPNEIYTYLGKIFVEDGVELSGGQWQKLSIAQAYFKDSKFLIMDEPSASLDPESEHKMFLKMKSLCSDKGALFITHRLSCVSAADRIIVVDSGECTEIGTHQELMRENGTYTKLFTYQAEKYAALSE